MRNLEHMLVCVRVRVSMLLYSSLSVFARALVIVAFVHAVCVIQCFLQREYIVSGKSLANLNDGGSVFVEVHV